MQFPPLCGAESGPNVKKQPCREEAGGWVTKVKKGPGGLKIQKWAGGWN